MKQDKSERNRVNWTGSNFSSNQWIRILWFFLIGIAVFSIFGIFQAPQRADLAYSRFKEYLHKDKVQEVVLKNQKIYGGFKGNVEVSVGDDTKSFDKFVTIRPPFDDPSLMNLLEEKNVTIQAEASDNEWLDNLLIVFLPWLLIIGLFFYASRKMQNRMPGGGAGPFGFGKSKAKLYSKSASETSFKDVAGMESPKKELTEIIEYLKDPERFRRLGGDLPKGVMVIGPPGTGKTLLAKAVAGEANVPFFSISGSEFIEMFVGVGASRVRDMFKDAKKNAPSIIFIDEIDSIGRVRGTGLGGGHDEREQTLNQILNEMDGFTERESVVVMAATNRPDVLDPALLRPGRFDRKVMLNLPQKKARKEILQVHTRDVPLSEDVDLEKIAAGTVGFSGADLKNLVNEATLLAGRKNKEKVDDEDFDQARDKIIMGLEREDLLNEEDRKVIAYHEAGHTVVAYNLPGTDPVRKVTIIPRGQALGATEQLPEEERYNMSRTYLLNRITVLLGGRCAEKQVLAEITSGAADDLKKATQMAQQMVSQWGMSEKVGLAAFPRSEPHPFLGREITQPQQFSEKTAQLIDEEIMSILHKQEAQAEKILQENQDNLEELSQELLKEETLEEDQIKAIFGPKKEEANADETEKTGSDE